MFDYLFSIAGRMDRPHFLRAATVVAGLCLMILIVIARGGLDPILHAPGQPVGPRDLVLPVFARFLGLVAVIFLPAPIIVKRFRDLCLPGQTGFAGLAIIECLAAALIPQGARAIEGPFAALAVMAMALIVLSVLPGPEEAADEALAAEEALIVEEAMPAALASSVWTALAPAVERRRGTVFEDFALTIEQATALDTLRLQGALPSYPDFTAGEGFGRRRGDRR